MWCFVFLCLSVGPSVCLSQLSPLHRQNLNLAANQNNIFMRILFTLWPCQWCIFNLDILLLLLLLSPQMVYLALRCIFHLSDQSFVMIFRNNHVCVCLQTTNPWKRKRWIFSGLFKWGRTSCRLVNWCNKMILCDGWRLPHDVQTYVGSTFLWICWFKVD